MSKGIDKLYQHQPCGGDVVCPFRKDCPRGWLSRRAREIADAPLFVCHKNPGKQCAGHMLVAKNNTFLSLAIAMQIPISLKGQDGVFDSEADFLEHHEGKD